jgi:branched-chain amino acid transport system ATP-binding protein
VADALLVVRDLHAWYGESHILHGVTFDVRAGEVVTLLGRNGAGKTTTLKSIMGMVDRRNGSIRFSRAIEGSARGEAPLTSDFYRATEGSARGAEPPLTSDSHELIHLPANRIARLGIAFCPEERGIFASLNVEENLLLPPVVRPGGLGVDAIFGLFPNLKERLRSQGTKLSGGEQQMLAIGRILRTGARLLLLDEPTEGLAPVVVKHIGATIRRLKAEGFTILLVEQNFRFAATVADRHCVMEHGRVVDVIPNAELDRSAAKLHEYLGV